jgi:hypothetical protein
MSERRSGLLVQFIPTMTGIHTILYTQSLESYMVVVLGILHESRSGVLLRDSRI